MNMLTKPSAHTPVGISRQVVRRVDVLTVIACVPSSSPPFSSILVKGVEDTLGIGIKQRISEVLPAAFGGRLWFHSGLWQAIQWRV